MTNLHPFSPALHQSCCCINSTFLLEELKEGFDKRIAICMPEISSISATSNFLLLLSHGVKGRNRFDRKGKKKTILEKHVLYPSQIVIFLKEVGQETSNSRITFFFFRE